MAQTNALSGYPAEIDILDAAQYPADPDPGSLKHSKVSDAAYNIEVELGINPSGTFTDVAAAIASKADDAATTSALQSKADVNLAQYTKTGSAYTLALGDRGALVEVNNASANTVTVPADATLNFPVGSVVGIRQYGAGQISIAAASGVVLRSRGGALKLAGQYAEATLTKRAANEWILSGDVTT